MPDILHALLDVNDCVLVIIDIQDHFLQKFPPEQADLLVNRVGWLMEIAKILGVPLVATAEESHRLNGLIAALAEKLPPGTPVYNKMVFGLAAQPDILQAIRQTGRKTAVLVGLETDVCVAQSALGLLGLGFQVVAVADATDSPGGAHATGLARMQAAGALVTSLKALYYEWLRTVEMNNTLEREHGARLGTPQGILL